MASTQSKIEWLRELLVEVDLMRFYSKITEDLQVTELAHFDHVSESDLLEVGLSKPAARRLLAALDRRRSFFLNLKSKLVNKLIPNSSLVSSSSQKSKGDFMFSIPTANEKQSTQCNQVNSSLTCLIRSDDIQVKEDIGHGVHGFVKKGEWSAPNGRVVEVALKILKKDVKSEPGASFNDFVKEISVMHQLNHPNIIKLYGVVLSSPMMMVTELAPFGNLRDKLRTENGHTPISQLMNFGVQIASGMEYLERKRFVHRDLAARNIFISHGKKILIGDLGLMRAISTPENHYVMSEKTKIPYPWCAPESLRSKQFSSASDVYMFGVTLWEMFSFGKEPWASLNLNEILDNISTPDVRLPCPEACPAMVYQTLLQCWNVDPSKRPNFSTLKQYLCTSYPLEVQVSQNISEMRRDSVQLVAEGVEDQNILPCNVDDRILVIDWQPEKSWWKGQNQRTFQIGWFPLNSTKWLPKKNMSHMNKPMRDDSYYYNRKDLSEIQNQADLKKDRSAFAFRNHLNIIPRYKAKAKLSRLFGLTGQSQVDSMHIINHAYHKLNNQAQYAQPEDSPTLRNRSMSSSFEPQKKQDDGPLLIDFSDEVTDSSTDFGNKFEFRPVESNQQQSLIDFDFEIQQKPSELKTLQRTSSDTQLNGNYTTGGIYCINWGGSWNSGTFYGSNTNIYSEYCCPQDATGQSVKIRDESNRYYSDVANDDLRILDR